MDVDEKVKNVVGGLLVSCLYVNALKMGSLSFQSHGENVNTR